MFRRTPLPFDLGQKVRLRYLDGPPMMVIDTSHAYVVCFWYDKNNAPHTQYFEPEFLEVCNE